MTFTENWYHENNLAFLASLAESTNAVDGRVIEVGVWEGRSCIALAGAVRPSVVHAVDTWAGSPGEISAALAAERDVYATFLTNVAGKNVEAHRMDWRDYFAADQTPVRFCHIDATHSYDEVFANVEAVKPLIVAGGILCGDDAHHEPVISAARAALGAVEQYANLWIWRPDGNR